MCHNVKEDELAEGLAPRSLLPRYLLVRLGHRHCRAVLNVGSSRLLLPQSRRLSNSLDGSLFTLIENVL